MGPKTYKTKEEARTHNPPCSICGKRRFVALAIISENSTEYQLVKPIDVVAHLFCPGKHEENHEPSIQNPS